MSIELVTAWLLAILPMTISPGPANTMFAASGATFGIRKTIPFWLGINTVCVIQTLTIGIGMGELLFRYPILANIFKYGGVLFLLYLALQFFRMSKLGKTPVSALGFTDGVILEMLNFKFLMIPTIMFSQFLDADGSKWQQVIILTVALNVLNMSGHWVWIGGGEVLIKSLNKDNIARFQNLLFGGMLVIVAGWMAIP